MCEERQVGTLTQRNKMVRPRGTDFIAIHQGACLSCRCPVDGFREPKCGMCTVHVLTLAPGTRWTSSQVLARAVGRRREKPQRGRGSPPVPPPAMGL